jgi:hypothetical protein
VDRFDEHRSDNAGKGPYEILSEGGNVALRKARLEAAMKRYADVRSVCYPPRIFLSYKWESAEHRTYVASLADALIEAGWEVVIDRDFKPERYASVEEFVAQLATCGIFLAVATYPFRGLKVSEPVSSVDPGPGESGSRITFREIATDLTYADRHFGRVATAGYPHFP